MCAPPQCSAVGQVRVPSRYDRMSPGWAVQVEPFHCAQLPASATAMHMEADPHASRAPSAGKAEDSALVAVSVEPAYCLYLPSDDRSMQGPPGAHEIRGPVPTESVMLATGAHQLVPLKRDMRPRSSTARQRVGLAHETSPAARGMVLVGPHEPLVQTR